MISIVRSGMISILPSGMTPGPRRLQLAVCHDKQLNYYYNLVNEVKLPTIMTISHHITALQNKVRRLYFIVCKFYVASRAFAQEPFLTYEHQPQH